MRLLPLPLLLLLFSLGSPHASAQTVDELLDATQPVKRKLDGGEYHYYRIMLATGQYVRLVIDQRGIDVNVKLLQPDGKIVTQSNRLIGAYGPETISWVAESPGSYKLEVRSARSDDTPGYYEVKIVDERTATFPERAHIPAQNVFVQAELLRDQQSPASLDQAIAKYEEALQIWKENEDRYGEAETLNVLGLVHDLLKRDRVKARRYFDNALQIWQALGNRRGEAETLNNIARIHENLGERQPALDYYNRALQSWRDAGDRYGEAWTLFNIGRVYSLLRDAPKALDHHQKALKLWQDLSELSRQAATLNSIGDVYFASTDYQNALSSYQQARTQWQAAGDLNGEVSSLYSLRKSYAVLKDQKKENEFNALAEQLALQVQQARAQTPENKAKSDKVRLAELAQQDARFLLRQGTPESQRQALAKNEEAVGLFDSAGDYDRELFTIFDISSIYRMLGEKDNERKTLDRARSLAQRIGRPSLRAEALQRFAEFHLHFNDRLNAADDYDDAIEIWKSQGDRRSEAYALASAAKVYNSLNNKEQALAYLNRARKLYQELGDRIREAYTLTDLAAIYRGPDEKQKALDYLKQTRDLRREKGDPAGEAETLKEIVAVYLSMNEKTEALDYYHQALGLYRRVGDGLGEAFILRDLMEYWKEQNQPRLAILYGKQAINTYQEIRQNIQSLERETQTSFIKSKEDIYRELADLLISEDRLPEAQQVLDMLKEEEFNNFIRGRRRKDASESADLTPIESELYKRYKQLTENATTLSTEYNNLLAKRGRTTDENDRLRGLTAQINAVNEAFQNYFSQLPKALASSKDVQDRVNRFESLKDTLKHLGPGSVALYTLHVKDRYRVILFTPSIKVARQHSINAADLKNKILALRAALHKRTTDPIPPAQDLYRILIEPIAKDLEGANAKTLMWSLDGLLRYVPMAALHDGKNYLVEQYRNEIFTPTSLVYLREHPNPSWRGLGLGVSTFKSSERLDPLPAVVDELNGIFRNEDDPKATRGTFPGKIMLNDKFTKDAMMEALQLQQYTVVHIATHFKLIPGNGLTSYLVLGNGDKLTGAQIKHSGNMFGGVDLLTLSACNTAVGTGNGAEVDGFGELAQQQGAKAVVASLWPVADASTGLFMKRFYELRMRDGKSVSKAESLQEAQRAFLRKEVTASDSNEKDYSHPYYWAPFILIGNWK